MPDGPDAELLGRFVQGDQQAFESLFRQFEADVHRWIVRIIRDHSAADDVLVEAFWRAYRGRAHFDTSRSFGAWMRRIATNAALDQLTASKRRRGWRSVDEGLAAPATRDSGVAEAVALGVPIGTVKSRVFKATRLLREELARLGIRP